ncbi:hypothetical protein BM221_000575 [Beauveria bassiana]|uniref:Uncharacterized protein n=1 Tax=Beauveria bassiana TaxID=176275 RepID=A0A2N6P0V1_BEABA|nr:hypothetical protein BM221_000575 [Beauveria bassiana]
MDTTSTLPGPLWSKPVAITSYTSGGRANHPMTLTHMPEAVSSKGHHRGSKTPSSSSRAAQ